MRADYSNTFWNNKFSEQVDKLQAFIPSMGDAKHVSRVIEDGRRMVNLYYEIYNNGGCNWNTSRGSTALVRRLVKKYLYKEGAEGIAGVEPKFWFKESVCPRYGERIWQRQVDNLEALATAVFIAACNDRVIELPEELKPTKKAKKNNARFY